MNYQIISESRFTTHKKIIAKLIAAVNEEISLGWEPIGGVVVGTHYCQTLVKKRA